MIATDDNNGLIRANRTANNASNRDTSDIVIRLKRRHHHLQRTIRIPLRCGDLLHNRLHQRFQIVTLVLHLELCNTVTRRRIDHREVKLIVVRIEFHKEFEDLIIDIIHALIRAVNLVDNNDRLELLLKRFAQHILCLRHRSLKRIDKEEHAIHHIEDALHLTAKVCMPRCIYNIDLNIIVENCRVLRENRNAALTLNIPRVHHALAHLLVRAEHMTLPQHRIHKSRLTVVNVGNNCDIAQLFIRRHRIYMPPHSFPCIKIACLSYYRNGALSTFL